MTLNLRFKPTSPIPCCIFFSGNHRPRARGWSCRWLGSCPPELYTKILEHPFIFETRVPPLLTLA